MGKRERGVGYCWGSVSVSSVASVNSDSSGSDSSGSVDSSDSGSVVSANSAFDFIVKTVLIIDKAPMDIPESSMPSLKPYSNCRAATNVNSAEANIMIGPVIESM